MLAPVQSTHRLEPLLNPASIAIVGASNNAARSRSLSVLSRFFCPVFFASLVILRISISSTSTASSSAEISCAFTNAVRIASRRSSGILLIYFTDAIPA